MSNMTEKTSVQITTMEQADLQAIIKIHQVAFPNNRSTALGTRFLLSMYTWFHNNYPHTCLVARLDGQVVGFIAGARPQYGPELFKSCILSVFLGIILHPRIVFNRSTYWSARAFLRALFSRKSTAEVATLKNSKNVFDLASIAVAPGFRGQGIASTLVNAFEARAFERAVDEITLTTSVDNIAARRVYEKKQWTVRRIHDGVVNYEKCRPQSTNHT